MCLHYIERREGNIINTQELKKILAQAPKETDHWDFKQKWYSKENGGNGELVLDILNFANTVHNDDCYIILGVSDDGKIVGVETDPNRKNTQKLQDLISKVDFAQNSYPKTNIETFEIDGHSLDVITIYNSKEVPYFLRKNKKRKNKAEIIAGKIYSRVGDSNTPNDGSISDKQLENLFNKRFGLDEDINTKYKCILKEVNNWNYILDQSVFCKKYIYKPDPIYTIEISNYSEYHNLFFEPFIIDDVKTTIRWKLIKLYFNNTVVANYPCIELEKSQAIIIEPDYYEIKLDNYLNYYGFLKNDIRLLLNNILNSNVTLSQEREILNNIQKNIVIFKNQKQKSDCEKKFVQDYRNKLIKFSFNERYKTEIAASIYNLLNLNGSEEVAEKVLEEKIICKFMNSYIEKLDS
ncbi:ATP-binding protein [Lactobacillus mulieris]|uniref:ATP-binding protein n=1 Tax=Lactobacillus mulieris TaxID=2508708 RepID=A0AAW5WY33_9LACO|nr:ATP-binding protein [Lactobacillus mulieris]MCZ3622448.1 ATP-binding protein [Lactobacillus mulieris]MCZ3624131.1 ATP-binding protein [Lactobacillus mulieris]MCZ3636455.1 ATP-binding protein [Lactobacillus mulieris]MCZ3690253.1 ATP-binding protein [Lactobacillus mulieris]MCZ3696093.1 ATP-binding protein [Lactobacillus mulieris]